MQSRFSSLSPDQPDPDILNRLFFVQQVCLVLVIQIGVVALCAHASAALGSILPGVLTAMPALAAAAALLCALALLLSEPGKSSWLVLVGQSVAAFTACAAGSVFFERLLLSPAAWNALVAKHTALFPDGAHSVAAPAVFLLIAVVIMLMRARQPVLSVITDATTCILSLLVLALVLDFLFSAFDVSPSKAALASPQTLVCLILLTIVAILRRAEYGALSFLLGYGMGSRAGRGFLPLLIVLPFLRELGRARLLSAQLIPSPYFAPMTTAVATLLSLGLLFFLCSHINRMQVEIQDLTLRDELTGLYNLRGFNLLAEQAMLLSRRAHQEFGVLFVDLDNLKTINDSHGHSIGSATLVETAMLLRATFRDTDVIARVGGDEFVVAGQFDLESISAAIDRLQSCAGLSYANVGRRFELSLSLGYAAANHPRDTLKDLVMRADQAMYDEKRNKKMLATA
ncbi:MAG TPA: GGDEF domain-containing protein [Terracidiphilus sp.]|jgi:diguanylate cyclase (GGDEF)-like protein|nr:GGDEF domain-containing protein [Terracidiphilus sp.]